MGTIDQQRVALETVKHIGGYRRARSAARL